MFQLPTTFTRVSSEFGVRVHPVTGATSTHKGIDLAAATGTPVYAARSGKVTWAATDPKGIAGNWIKIDHGAGYATGYMHLSQIGVSAGQFVTAGQRIGAVGATGRVTGPHLHFIVYKDGVEINPRPLLLWQGIQRFSTATAAAAQRAATSGWAWGLGAGVLLLVGYMAYRRRRRT